jgi:hypothetical protein
VTRAQQGLKDARPEIGELLRTAEKLSDEVPVGRRMSPQEIQARHVVVSLVALLQSYITDLLEQKADEMSTNWDELDENERRYVAVQSRRRLQALLEGCEESALVESGKVDSLRETVLHCAAWYQNPSLLSRSAYRDKLDGFLNDNGTNVLDRVISRFGHADMRFFNWLYKNRPRYRGIKDTLDLIIDIRNDVAHGRIRRRVTLREVREHRVRIYRLIGKIQEYMETVAPTHSASGEAIVAAVVSGAEAVPLAGTHGSAPSVSSELGGSTKRGRGMLHWLVRWVSRLFSQ